MNERLQAAIFRFTDAHSISNIEEIKKAAVADASEKEVSDDERRQHTLWGGW